jgi:ABC-type antimicrobial peptide transport system permease subunit
MRYVREQPMGFTRDAVVLINLPSDSTLKLKYDYLKSRMQDIPGVTPASLCVDAPSADWKFAQEFYFDTDPVKQPFKIEAKAADADYYKTFGIRVKAGRLPYPSDTLKELVVNETTVKKLGLSSPEKIIGKTITSTEHKTYPVVGVINDFNSQSLHEAITPMLIGSDKNGYEFIALRLNPQKMTGALKKVQQTFTGIYPSYLYDLTFLDERISNYYQADAITAKLFKIFAGLAVFISCLGLYGLISFMVVNRTREVGIRKVLGASINSILFLFSKEFMLLIMVAFLIAAPLGYYFMQGWLSGFYYHTAIGAGIFVLAVFLSVLVAWITVGYKAFSAALANPVKSLKE